jgi:Protein of unknown function (DUF4058)
MTRTFNGIDPYVEAQGYCRDFHHRFLTYCAESLADALPANYEARIDEQMTLLSAEPEEVSLRKAIPDVGILRTRSGEAGVAGASNVATLEPVTIGCPCLRRFAKPGLRFTGIPGEN